MLRLSFFLLNFFVVILIMTTTSPAYAAPAPASATFFPLLPVDAPPDTEPSLLPVASNHPLDGPHPGVRQGFIVIHDFSREANKSLAVMTELAGESNGETMIMAPQFLLDSDIARYVSSLPEQGRAFARWTIGGWGTGDESLPTPTQKSISSFSAIDLMLMYLADRALFPDMQSVTLVGHGEGGDFVQRYAAVGVAPDILAQQNLAVHFIVANAASYLYLNNIRPRAQRQGFSPPDDGVCKDYNQWPYGLENLNGYARHEGLNAIKTRFATRQIAYLVGENASKNDPAPDTSCAAMLQGGDRPSRAVNYTTYIGLLFGEAASAHEDLTVVPGATYDASALYASTCGMTLLFGDGDCTPAVMKAQDRPMQ
jgi:hypothetical protein